MLQSFLFTSQDAAFCVRRLVCTVQCQCDVVTNRLQVCALYSIKLVNQSINQSINSPSEYSPNPCSHKPSRIHPSQSDSVGRKRKIELSSSRADTIVYGQNHQMNHKIMKHLTLYVHNWQASVVHPSSWACQPLSTKHDEVDGQTVLSTAQNRHASGMAKLHALHHNTWSSKRFEIFKHIVELKSWSVCIATCHSRTYWIS